MAMKINGLPLPQGWGLKEFFDNYNNTLDGRFYQHMSNPNLPEDARLDIFYDRLANPEYNPGAITIDTPNDQVMDMINYSTHGTDNSDIMQQLKLNASNDYGLPVHSFIGTETPVYKMIPNFTQRGVDTPEVRNVMKLLGIGENGTPQDLDNFMQYWFMTGRFPH